MVYSPNQTQPIDPYWRNLIVQLLQDVATLKRNALIASKVTTQTGSNSWYNIGSITGSFSVLGTNGNQQYVWLSWSSNITIDINCTDWFYDLQIIQSGTWSWTFTASSMSWLRIINSSFINWMTFVTGTHNFVFYVEGWYANISYSWLVV